jgi:rsbT co-antagonist protein RsbR
MSDDIPAAGEPIVTAPERPIDFDVFYRLSPEIRCVLDGEGRFEDINPAGERAFGLSAEKIRGKSLADLVHEGDREAVLAALQRVRDPESSGGGEGAPVLFTCRVRRADESLVWLSWSAAKGATGDSVIASGNDITRERRSLRRFQLLLDAAPDFVAICSTTGDMLHINPSGLSLIGRSGQDPATLKLRDITTRDSLARFVDRQREVLDRDGIITGEAELLHADGSAIPVERTSVILRDATGAPEAYGIIATDIRAQKRDEARLHKLRMLMEATSDCIGIATLDGRIEYINPAGMKMLGRYGEDATRYSVRHLLNATNLTRFTRHIIPVLREHGLWAGELDFLKRDGRPVPVSQVIILCRDESGAPDAFATVARDLTNQKELEASLRDAIRSLSTPILAIWPGVLALPVIGRVDTNRASQMMESLLDAIVKTRCRVAILDLTGAAEISASTVEHILQMVSAAALLGSLCVLSGVSASVARTIVELDLELDLDVLELRAFARLEEALRYAIEVVSSGA